MYKRSACELTHKPGKVNLFVIFFRISEKIMKYFKVISFECNIVLT